MKKDHEFRCDVASDCAASVEYDGGQSLSFNSLRLVEVGDHLQAIAHVFQLLEFKTGVVNGLLVRLFRRVFLNISGLYGFLVRWEGVDCTFNHQSIIPVGGA